MLDPKARAKAVRLTPKYAYDCEWLGHIEEIYDLIAYPRPVSPSGPDMGTFVDCVARFQADPSNGLKADGILGPNTWAKMKGRIDQPPRRSPPPPAFKDIPAEAKSKPTPGGRPNSGAWVGLVIDYGVMIGPLGVAVGKNYAIGTVYSVDDPNVSALISAERFRFGAGGGGGLGAALVFISNCYEAHQMHGVRNTGFDFNLSLGAKFGAMAKGAIKARRWATLIEKFAALKRQGLGGHHLHQGITRIAREASQLGPDEAMALAKAYRESGAMEKTVTDSKEVSICTLTLPIGIAVEASVFWQEEDWVAGAPQEAKPTDLRGMGAGIGDLYGPHPVIGM